MFLNFTTKMTAKSSVFELIFGVRKNWIATRAAKSSNENNF